MKHHKTTILLVSENASWAWSLGVRFLQTGIFITERANHFEAPTLHTKHHFDAIIVDDSLPNLETVQTMLKIFKVSKTKLPKIIAICNQFFEETASFDKLPRAQVDLFRSPISQEEIITRTMGFLAKGKPKNQKGTQKPPAIKIDTGVLNVFIRATIQTLEEMAQIRQVVYGSPFVQDKEERETNIAINGQLIIQGDLFNGSIFISFPEQTYLDIYHKVVLEKVDKIDESNEDMANEFAKFVYGHAVLYFREQNIKIGKAKSRLTYAPYVNSTKPVIVVPFETQKGPFYIKIAEGLVK